MDSNNANLIKLVTFSSIIISVFVIATSAQTEPVETCFDVLSTCDGYDKLNKNFCQYPLAKRQCRLFCGYCNTMAPPTTAATTTHPPPTTTTTTPPPPTTTTTTQRPVQVVTCKNSHSDAYCSQYSPLSCPQYVGFYRDNCAQFCGYCDIDDVTSGFHGKCLYKETVYEEGEKWNDGSDYECVCKDGRIGEVECTNRCPAYYNVPPQCTFVEQKGEFCLQPVCNFGGVLHVNTILGKGTDKDGNAVCVENGREFEEGSLVRDDCTSKCQCVDASKGNITCHDTCPQYDSNTLPSNCRLEKEPGSCCAHPKCHFDTLVGEISGTGTTSGKGVDRDLTTYDPNDIKNCTDLDPECGNYTKDACTGKSAPYMTQNCPVYCGMCDKKYGKPVPGPEDRCFHQGVDYNTGEVWGADCLHECVCDDQWYGYYHCYNRCPHYTSLPTGCTLNQPTDECACPEMTCDSDKNITFSTTNIANLGGGDHVTKVYPDGNRVPVLPPLLDDGTIDPSWPQPKGIVGCLRNGRLLIQGEISSSQNCSDVCQCVDEHLGKMVCYDRCSTYVIDPACQLVADSADSCCLAPDCPASVTTPPTKKPKKPKVVIGKVTTPDPKDLVNKVNMTVHTTPDPMTFTTPGLLPESANPPPTMPPNHTVTHNDRDCEYSGNTYTPGDRWVDGCDYNCLCVGGVQGEVVCLERCKHFTCPNGSVCNFHQDPTFPCCKLMRIQTPKPSPTTPTTPPPTTTPETGSGDIPDGWLLLLKGVSGIPGDLHDLWTGSKTLNPGDNETQALTPDHPVHYKSVYAERFDKCQFEKVRLSIYSRGVEKAWVVFNASGTDKNGWFSDTRVEDSSWAGGQMFNTRLVDVNLNRQWEVYDTIASPCSNTGWMFVSTMTGGCVYQNQVNQFHFSPLSTPVSYGEMEQGDVLAILAKGGVCDVENPQPLSCPYKNQVYLVGESWEDGCTETCNCSQVGPDTAEVICQPMCETYINLNPGCHAVKQPGECCETLVGETCHGGGKCWDKFFNKTRAVGVVWRVGCDYECDCSVQQGVGYVMQCVDICLTWDLTGIQDCVTPTPMPGKCCALPVCPGVVFDIPDRHKKDY